MRFMTHLIKIAESGVVGEGVLVLPLYKLGNPPGIALTGPPKPSSSSHTAEESLSLPRILKFSYLPQVDNSALCCASGNLSQFLQTPFF